MIISASRRTDIPALYSEWFVNRLREGQVFVPNPYNRKKISRIRLTPDAVDCIVFWTKNPEPLVPYLKEIDKLGYQYYIQMTITDYGKDMEPGIPSMEESMATFLLLSEMIGKDRIDWRFDPILLTDRYSIEYHAEKFATMCQWLSHSTERCIISFADFYGGQRYLGPEPEEMREVAQKLSKIAGEYRLPLYTCSEKIDLSAFGIQHGACIDKERIQKLTGYKMDLKKASGQRPQCRCVESIDIGIYDTCTNGCEYCYATRTAESAERKRELHDPASPLLIGQLRGDETVVDREIRSSRDYQLSLFDWQG